MDGHIQTKLVSSCHGGAFIVLLLGKSKKEDEHGDRAIKRPRSLLYVAR